MHGSVVVRDNSPADMAPSRAGDVPGKVVTRARTDCPSCGARHGSAMPDCGVRRSARAGAARRPRRDILDEIVMDGARGRHDAARLLREMTPTERRFYVDMLPARTPARAVATPARPASTWPPREPLPAGARSSNDAARHQQPAPPQLVREIKARQRWHATQEAARKARAAGRPEPWGAFLRPGV